MFGLFGVVEYIFPVIMAFTLVFMISNKNIIAVARIKTAAVYIFTIILSAVWLRIVNEPKIAVQELWNFLHTVLIINPVEDYLEEFYVESFRLWDSGEQWLSLLFLQLYVLL